MNDLISRQEAIDAVHAEFDECLVWDESGQHTADEVERILVEVPSAEQRWIPCSERMPERSDYYLVTEVLAFDEGEYPDVVSVKLEWYSTINKAWHDIPPVAWMPLPEPYKERSEK